MSKWTLGIIGGSGLYDIPGIEGAWEKIDTPWGAPSDEVFRGKLNGLDIVFLPRHGRGHRVSPTFVNYRANIDALKRAGCTDILAFSACGSLKEELPPGHFVLVDQYVDRTHAREKSFFGEGVVAHVSMADPVCARLSKLAADASRKTAAPTVERGAYIIIEGPQFSSRAESELYRSWNMSTIGMTGMPEAKLAREAELPYAAVAMVTDYDCWRDEGEHVNAHAVVEVMHRNADNAKALVGHLATKLAGMERAPSPIDTALDFAIVTDKDKRDPKLVAKLDAVAGRVLKVDSARRRRLWTAGVLAGTGVRYGGA